MHGSPRDLPPPLARSPSPSPSDAAICPCRCPLPLSTAAAAAAVAAPGSHPRPSGTPRWRGGALEFRSSRRVMARRLRRLVKKTGDTYGLSIWYRNGVSTARLNTTDETAQVLNDRLWIPDAPMVNQRDYVYGPNGMVAQMEWGGTPRTLFAATDHLGHTRALFDGDGIVDLLDFYPFGEQLEGAEHPDTTHLFTGHERDLGTNSSELDYMHARYYSPFLARFVSVDPVGGRVGSSQSWNRYSYVLNNPIRLVDPDGKATRDGLLYLAEQRANMSPEQRARVQKVDAFVAGLMVSSTLAYLTAGQSLWANILIAGPASNMAGGIVNRTLDGDRSTEVTNRGALAVDYVTGLAGTLFGNAVVKNAAKKSIDNVAGVGVGRFLSEATSNTTTLLANEVLSSLLEPVTSQSSIEDYENSTLSCHITNVQPENDDPVDLFPVATLIPSH